MYKFCRKKLHAGVLTHYIRVALLPLQTERLAKNVSFASSQKHKYLHKYKPLCTSLIKLFYV